MNSVEKSKIKDINLAPSGHDKINWVKNFMPVMNAIEKEYSVSKPFAGIRMVMTMHLEAKTAYLALVLQAAGAEVIATASNPLSTQDDVCAALVEDGVTVFAHHGCDMDEYDAYIDMALDCEPDIIMDDGGDLIYRLHNQRRELLPKIIGGSEETTTGVIRDRALEAAGKLEFPMMAANDAYCKYLFDNRYGTGQSTWEGIMRATNLVIAGKTVVIAGYGWCGKGGAMRAKGLGANVIITEVDPIKAIEAVFDGCRVMPMIEAAKEGDIFVTVTGCKDVITKEHMQVMKNGAVMCNAGHFDVEIEMAGLRKMCIDSFEQRNNIMGYTVEEGRTIYVLGEGRLVNLACGDGHPAEIMDMSFAIQALSARYLVQHAKDLTEKLIVVPKEVDNEVAVRKLNFLGKQIDQLTPEQEKYLFSSSI